MMVQRQRLALFLGVCWTCFGWASLVPMNLDKTLGDLNKHYKFKDDKTLYNGGSIFLRRFKNFKGLEQQVLTSAMLNTYDRIITSMQQNLTLKEEDVQESLEHLHGKLNQIKNEYFNVRICDMKKSMEELLAIQANDPVVQRKALFEMRNFYRKVMNLADRLHRDAHGGRAPTRPHP